MTLDSRFILESFEPAYLAPAVRESLPKRVQAALAGLQECRACPRRCGADRLKPGTADPAGASSGATVGVCRTGRYARVSSAFPHHGEEACLTGTGGSGTIFFARCNLRCVFCQNWDISQADDGHDCPPERIAGLMLTLQERGCHNINLVTPEHAVPQVIEAVAVAIDQGLRLPIVYNTSAYDSIDSLRQLDGLIDIYMPDIKFFTPERSQRYLGARDYGPVSRAAVAEMHRQVGELLFRRDGVACRGLLVRHLVMPGLLDETAAILDWLAYTISRDTFVNIMDQYRPAFHVGLPVPPDAGGSLENFAEINRRCTSGEIQEAGRAARRAGLWRFDH